MEERQLAFEAIGTRWTIGVRSNMDDKSWGALVRALQTRIVQFDKTYSRFRSDSFVSHLSRAAGIYPLPEDAYPLLQFYEQLYRATTGSVTPLIGQTMSDAGYDAAYSLRPKQLHRPPEWDQVLRYDKRHITLHQPALLDFGAAGKGYLVDLVHELLVQAGSVRHSVNAGGDIFYYATDDERLDVGLENPQNPQEAIGVASIHNQSICASSGSRRAWGKYHHIIDPFVLQSPRDVMATWVAADTAMQADGLATALFFTKPVVLQKQFTFSYALLDSDLQLTRSHDFPAVVYEAVA